MLNLLEDIFPVTIGIIIIFAIIFIILLPFIASWNLFKKVGIPGYKSLIPIYNQYLILKIAGMHGIWLIIYYSNLIIDILKEYINNIPDYVNLIFYTIYLLSILYVIIRAYKLARAFDKGLIFTLGLIFFPELFMIILGLGKSKYIGEYEKEN